MKQIDKVFVNQTLNVIEFLQRNGVGLYIPVYQREYSWDEDNINQLIEDIEKGIEDLATNETRESEIRFLGTIISVKEQNKTKIEPIDYAGIPESVEKIIDGQQRITTILIFAVCAYCKFKDLENKLKKSSRKDEVEEIISSWLAKLIEIICLDLKRGNPKLKPKLIRGSIDKWIKDGDHVEAYRSEIASLLSALINFHVEPGTKFIWKGIRNHKITENKKLFDNWLKDLKDNTENTFPEAVDLIDSIEQKDIWFYERPDLVNIIKDNENKENPAFVEVYKLCLICHYLLERSVFVLIQPTSEEWAFDMFQSLNASGTPLTSIETFKPYVVNVVESAGETFKSNHASKYFGYIEKLFEATKKANDKNKRTSEYLITFANSYSASFKEMSSHFTSQRKWLNKEFEKIPDLQKIQFVRKLGDFASFLNNGWYDFEGLQKLFDDVSYNYSKYDLYQKFLIDSKHLMAATILGRFYSQWLESKTKEAKFEYLDALEAVVGFYVLWRCVLSNNGLDSAYRNYFKADNYWQNDVYLNSKKLKEYFLSVLSEKNFSETEVWVNKASSALTYSSKHLIRFILILYSHDTIVSASEPGMCSVAREGVNPMLSFDSWVSKDLKSIEHIAPQNRDERDGWDSSLYDEDSVYDSVGNLTLLPGTVNSSVGNKGFEEKLSYYKFLGCKESSDFEKYLSKAKDLGLQLSEKNIELLKLSNYSKHLESIKDLDYSFTWSKQFVMARTKNILNITSSRLFKMLN